MWASPLPAKKPGSLCLVGSLRTPPPVSTIKMERCPPSAWNGVRLHGGMLSAIRAEWRPGWRGIRTAPIMSATASPKPVARNGVIEPEIASGQMRLRGQVDEASICTVLGALRQ